MKRGNKTSDLSTLLLLAIILITAAGGFVIFRILRTDPIEEALAKGDVINILFVLEGAWTEEEHSEKPLGSFVLIYSPEYNRAAVISVPGDVGMKLATVDKVDRIDAVYNSRNISPFTNEIENLLGLDIGYFVILEAENLGKIVDLFEGVGIFIPQTVEIYEDPPILFPSGNTALDGDKAKQYISYHIPEEDREQVYLRRERFFLAFLKTLNEKSGILENSQMADAFYPLLRTKMPRRTRERLFRAIADIDISRVSIQSVAGNYQEVSGQELLLPYFNGTVIKEIVSQARRNLGSGVLAERIFTVEILNGTATAGLASRTAELIRGFRYDVIATGNANHGNYEKTEIIDRTGQESAASAFANTIKCKNIRHEPKMGETDLEPGAQTASYRADFTLIIGRDFNGRVVAGN